MANIAKIYNEDLFDFVIRSYGSLDFLTFFLDENDIDDILYFNNQPAGTLFIITPQPSIVKSFVITEVEKEKIHKKVYNQNVFDFVITHYGNLEYLSQFINDNKIDDILSFGLNDVGTQFNVITQSNNRVTNSYIKYNYNIATGSNPPTPDFNSDFSNDFFAD